MNDQLQIIKQLQQALKAANERVQKLEKKIETLEKQRNDSNSSSALFFKD